MNSKTKLMRRVLKISSPVMVLFMLVFCGSPTTIRHHMVKPESVRKISKFRSCCGHDYSNEGRRSMKHYISPLNSYSPVNDQFPIYAPFDGNLFDTLYEEHVLECFNDGVPHGKQMRFASVDNPNFLIRLFHVNPVAAKGRIRAGEIIAYADLRSCDERNPKVQLLTPTSFDISSEGGGTSNFFSIFDHMDPSLLADWAQYGVTLDNVIIPKEARDADPCQGFDYQSCSKDEICLTGQTCNL